MEKREMKSKAEEQLKRESKMWGGCKMISVTCTRDIFHANMRLIFYGMMGCKCKRDGSGI
jgi:hypothetical protein